MPANDRLKRRALGVLIVAGLTVLTAVTMAPPAQAKWQGNWLTCKLGGKCPTTTTPGESTSSSSSTSSTATTATTAPTTTTTPPTDSCSSLPKAGGGTWECAFDDEFDGSALDRTKWTPQLTSIHSFDTGPECFVDQPGNIDVGDGSLQLTVKKEPAPIDCAGLHQSSYTSGMVTTNPKIAPGVGFAQTNGRYEVRMRVTGAPVKGIHDAIWMWPVDQVGMWPRSGEIDIAEIYHLHPDRSIPYIHYSNAADPNRTNNYCMIDDISKYHTYVLEWTPQALKISYDGVVCINDPWQPWLQAGRAPFDKPFYLILTQALGVGKNGFDPVNTPLPASTLVDYVRIWK
jgi:beta-glucanase (GH16 family)